MASAARKAFLRMPALPVDRAVMERSKRVAVIPVHFSWSDLGAWPRLADLRKPDAHGNLTWGPVMISESRDNLAFASEGLVVLWKTRGLFVARAGDVVLVGPRSEADNVRKIREWLRRKGLNVYL